MRKGIIRIRDVRRRVRRPYLLIKKKAEDEKAALLAANLMGCRWKRELIKDANQEEGDAP